MNLHTKGPWDYWSGYNAYDKIEAQVTAEGGDIVIASYNNLIAEGEANAKLIAAAPELLEALEKALSRMEEDAVKIEGEFGCGRSLQELESSYQLPDEIIAARDAIAKARGES
jgi:hypothetical protein